MCDMQERTLAVENQVRAIAGANKLAASDALPPKNIRIIVDENVDMMGIKLESMGYNVERIKVMRNSDQSMAHDFNILVYARDSASILITKDREVGKACIGNNIDCIWINDDVILTDLVLPKLAKLGGLTPLKEPEHAK